MSGMKLRIWGAVAVALVVAISAMAMTGDEAIKQRQVEMEGVKNGMMALGAIAKRQQPFDAEVVHANAAKIADHLAATEKLFPEGSHEGGVQTWAKAEIWTEFEQFEQLMKNTHRAAVDMQSVTEAAAFPPALGKLGTGCKSCHDLYRLPKN